MSNKVSTHNLKILSFINLSTQFILYYLYLLCLIILLFFELFFRYSILFIKDVQKLWGKFIKDVQKFSVIHFDSQNEDQRLELLFYFTIKLNQEYSRKSDSMHDFGFGLL